ncbi:c-type cytochrome [Roseitranquillus sediminis]|uniref:c-type cytochrome n=1 Tax=Roseitranquillus sediminis TaxID=2809051 RepID=UPI001D0C184F|nr:cytochrome c [Roseitranquillus sediminis]MBM9595463.1 cytochrome c [Roseitranquillus sediminis]
MRTVVRAKTTAATLVAALLASLGTINPALAQDESLSELMAEGRPLYQDNCAACHGDRGQGTGTAPALDGNVNLESRPLIINQVLWGSSEHGMPPFADVMTDREIAAVTSFVRNAWENEFGIVFPRSVELRR